MRKVVLRERRRGFLCSVMMGWLVVGMVDCVLLVEPRYFGRRARR